MRFFCIVDDEKDWQLALPDVEVVSAKRYITDPEFNQVRHVKVFNFCRSFRYQSLGYYISLLAEARGHKPIPSVQTIRDLKSIGMIRFVSEELSELIQQSLKYLKGDTFVLSLYFGKNITSSYDKLGAHLFGQIPTPLMQVTFEKNKGKWGIGKVYPMIPSEIPKEHLPFFRQVTKEYFSGKKVSAKKRASKRYDLAILHNPQEENAPSDPKALQKFIKAAEKVGFNVDLITKKDYNRIAEFDALFIRETTAVNHHTFRFARRAEAEGLVVIDDSDSILKCSNKVYLSEILQRHKIATPKTVVLHHDNIDEVRGALGFPCVLKQPDSAFSNGVVKIEDEAELLTTLPELLDKSDLLIAQQYIPTPFDWRVAILDKQPLFVCKYYMARRHWQIYEKSQSGKVISGRSETFPVGTAPKKIVSAALKAANLIGGGFYGVDLKEHEGNCYVIEINDNPSVDVGVEDLVLKDEVYLKIMEFLMRRVETKKAWQIK